MFIDNDVLITWGAVAKKYKKGEVVFNEGDHPYFYYQLISGKVRMFNTNAEGKEFTQGDFTDGDSFGLPYLFIDELYSSSAISLENSVILKIKKERIHDIFNEYPYLLKRVVTLFAKRIFDKASTMKEIVNNVPEMRILGFLNAYKKKHHYENQNVEIPYTRQEIANYTGLRVETVIRALNKMKTKNQVKIINRKLFF